jgi:hypothetical protein
MMLQKDFLFQRHGAPERLDFGHEMAHERSHFSYIPKESSPSI